MNDELRDILGDELFNELSKLSETVFTDDVQPLSEEQIKKLAETMYMVQIPVSGSFALDMMSALVHAHETDCQTCWGELNWFAISLIASMLNTMLDDIEGMSDES